MSSKLLRYVAFTLVGLVLLAGAFSGGILVGAATAKPVSQTVSAPVSPTGEMETLFAPFWETWKLVHEQYVDQPVNDLELMRGAIRGMLTSLGDKHTSYMDPTEYQQSTEPLAGEYEGIGAWVDTSGDYLTIISPIPNTPADKAGLKSGDKVIAVDGKDMTGTQPDLVLRQVKGPAGTKVKITIQREGEKKPLDFELVRSKIVIASVESKMLDGNIAYVKIVTFGDKTTAELKAALTDLMAKNPAGMVLDLRNNGGGYLTTAIEVVSQFVKEGVVMYEEYGDGTKNSFTAIPGGMATDIPLVVLVNEGTASASEITAGAIQDYLRGKLVGTVTYGKGSVQNWLPLNDNEGAVRITVARWLTPKERQINEKGLTPEFIVEITEEDVKAEKDPQLEKAVDLLKMMIK